MQQSWPARYLDGVTAHPESVTVTPAAHGLEIRRADNSIVVWRYVEVTQTQGDYDGEHVRLERGTHPVEALVVADPAFLSRLHGVAPRVSQRFHNPRTRVHRPALVLGAFVAAVVLGVGIYFWGIPTAAMLAAEQVPVSWEEELGESVSKAMIGSAPECGNKDVVRVVDDIVKRLAATVPGNPYTFRVSVVRRDVMNAFAAPGGRIVVFSGLLRRTDRAEELAGVLAHEMSHVVKRHGTKALFRDVSTSIFLAAVLGDINGASAAVLDGAKTLGGLHYSRQAEEEADDDGMRMLKAAGIEPSGMVSFFEKLEKPFGREKEILKYISTHPLTGERVAKLKAAQAKRGPFVQLSTRSAWKTLASACNPSL
jgi:beta-barrel assembly-enhancing protease